VVFKEWPVLGPESLIAAKASLASQKQGKYKEFHNALMDTKGRLSETAIMSIAEKSGLDVKKLKKDMDAPDVQEELKQNQALAAALQLEGTPAFVIGSQMAPGAINADTLQAMIDAARKN
jgi:protein-disulfide isomerase